MAKTKIDSLVEEAIWCIMFVKPNLNKRQAYGFLKEIVQNKANEHYREQCKIADEILAEDWECDWHESDETCEDCYDPDWDS
jgi:hypothetical protein